MQVSWFSGKFKKFGAKKRTASNSSFFQLKVEHCPANLNGTFWQPNSSAVKIHCTLLSKMTQFGRDPDSISGGDNEISFFFFSFFMV